MTDQARLMARNTEIVQARIRGLPWTTIANTYGVSARQCQQILRDYRGTNPTLRTHDPLEIVDDILEGLGGAIEELAIISHTTASDQIRVSAINAKLAAQKQIVAILQTVGVLPNDLGSLRMEVDARMTADRVMTVIEQFNLPHEVTDAMIVALDPSSFDGVGPGLSASTI